MNSHPGYEQFCEDLWMLLSTYPPPFIYVHDLESTRATCKVVENVLSELSNDAAASPAPPRGSPSSSSSSFEERKKVLHYACVDAVACFTPRLLFEAVVHSLVDWEPTWDAGCPIWNPTAAADAEGEGDDASAAAAAAAVVVVVARWNENLDTFLHGLRAAHGHLCGLTTGGARDKRKGKGKGKGKQKEKGKRTDEGEDGDGEYDNVRLVIVVEQAERLKEDHPELLVPLTRLAELARLDLVVIFISQVCWEDVRPPLGASPDPYYMDIPSPTKENIVRMLIAKFSTYSTSLPDDILTNPYHPTLSSLYTHFIAMLCDVCYPFCHDPEELQYIAAARWPGFVKPLIDEYKQRRRRLTKENAEEGRDEDDDDGDDRGMELDEVEFTPPTEDLRIRLIRYFNPSLTTAMEALLPRLTDAAAWALANEPPENLLSMSRAETGYQRQQQQQRRQNNSPRDLVVGLKSLPRMSKFILVASFLASMNPAKSDLRMLGRGLDEKKRKRRVMKTQRKTKAGGPSKIPQRLLGPAPFPLDRLIAILGALLEENDAESRPVVQEFKIPGEYTDIEISRAGVYSAITELTSMGVLHRTSPSDRLDGPPTYKCGVSYDAVLGLARDLDVGLNDLLWDPI